jgi:hypothetical protein
MVVIDELPARVRVSRHRLTVERCSSTGPTFMPSATRRAPTRCSSSVTVDLSGVL